MTDLRKLWSSDEPGKDKTEERRAATQAGPKPEEDPRKYQAFGMRDRPDVLIIRSAINPQRSPAYSYLLDAPFDQTHQSVFTLIYSFGLALEVRGKNLGPIVHAINYRQCDWIQEYHRSLFDGPPAEGEPFIESITLLGAKEAIKGKLDGFTA